MRKSYNWYLLVMATAALAACSSKPEAKASETADSSRASNSVSAYMRRNAYRVIPVNPNETSVFGEKAYPDLFAVPEKIDLVDVFRRSDEAGRAVDEAIAVGAKAVWMQEGVIDSAAAQRAVDAGLMVVMDRCWLKEHIRAHR